MITQASTIDANADLANVRLEEVRNDIPSRIYCPGGGYVNSLSAFPMDLVGGTNMRQLAALHQNPTHPLAVMVDAPCSQGCGATIRAMRMFAPVTCCEECKEKAAEQEWARKARTYWESICPPNYRDTSTNHQDFPRAQYKAVADYAGGESLFFLGDSRKGKTRLALLLLKRCLHRHNHHVGVLWPEELKQVRAPYINRLEWVQKWGRYDLLLWDDSLLTGAQDERIPDALKDLLEYRMRWKRHNIFTSQIGGAEFTKQANKFENVTSADLKRVEALLGRLKEECRVVLFVGNGTPKKETHDF